MDRRYFVTQGAANATYQERRINTSHVMVVHIVQNVRYEQNDRGVAQILPPVRGLARLAAKSPDLCTIGPAQLLAYSWISPCWT